MHFFIFTDPFQDIQRFRINRNVGYRVDIESLTEDVPRETFPTENHITDTEKALKNEVETVIIDLEYGSWVGIVQDSQ